MSNKKYIERFAFLAGASFMLTVAAAVCIIMEKIILGIIFLLVAFTLGCIALFVFYKIMPK